MPVCEQHHSLVSSLERIEELIAKLRTEVSIEQKDIEYLRRDQEIILSRIARHIDEADRKDGWHDQVRENKEAIKALRNDLIVMRWFMIGSGVIGGLIGAGAPNAVMFIARTVGMH